MKTALISANDVKTHLSYLDCIQQMELAFSDLHNEKAINHPRDILFLPTIESTDGSALGTMSAFSERYQLASTKIVGVFPKNSTTSKDVHQGGEFRRAVLVQSPCRRRCADQCLRG